MSDAHRVAIVGFGPKGLFAAERLAHEAQRADASMQVTIFEPHPVIGAGPVYDPRQPRFLRMNFASKHVNLWDPARGEGESGPSLVEWTLKRTDAASDPDGYAPRAVVGEYLHESAIRVLDQLSRSARVHVDPCEVRRVSRVPGGWQVAATDGRTLEVDDVLIATGHGSQLADPGRPPADAVVYPVGRELGPDRIPAGSTVALRGMALTALDAVVTLGRRTPDTRPERVVAFSRTGRPMLPKLASPLSRERIDGILEPARQTLRDASSTGAVGRAVVQGASFLLASMGRHQNAAASVLHVIMSDARQPTRRTVPDTALRRAIAIARGDRCWNAERALGEAWRFLYPDVVAWHAGHRLAHRDRAVFRRLCTELERLAFGPPVQVAEEFMQGVDDGWIDLAVAVNPTLEKRRRGWRVSTPRKRVDTDLLIDAVLPGAGIAPNPSPLFQHLLDDGHLRVRKGWPGVEVALDATAIGITGEPTTGLSVVGRPTEGSVLGNDTLDRTLHPHAALWACRVTARAGQHRLQLS